MTTEDREKLQSLCDTLEGRKPKQPVQFAEVARLVRKLMAEIDERAKK
jgi:hypothetical protein